MAIIGALCHIVSTDMIKNEIFRYNPYKIIKRNNLFLQPSIAKWRTVFITAGCVYAGCCSFYVLFGSGNRQSWDQPPEDDEPKKDRDHPEIMTTTA